MINLQLPSLGAKVRTEISCNGSHLQAEQQSMAASCVKEDHQFSKKCHLCEAWKKTLAAPLKIVVHFEVLFPNWCSYCRQTFFLDCAAWESKASCLSHPAVTVVVCCCCCVIIVIDSTLLPQPKRTADLLIKCESATRLMYWLCDTDAVSTRISALLFPHAYAFIFCCRTFEDLAAFLTVNKGKNFVRSHGKDTPK